MYVRARGLRSRRAVSCALAVIATSATVCITSPVAFADGGGQPLTLVPVPPPPPPVGTSPGVTPNAQVGGGHSYMCTDNGTLRRKWKSYVTGWCTTGMHIDISSSDQVQGFQPGWGEGNFNHCGWFETSVHILTLGGTFNHDCKTNWDVESTFASAINLSSTGGTGVQIKSVCPRYLNVQPWSSGATVGQNQAGTLQPSTDTFAWRYRTLNNLWVLGQMTRSNTPVSLDWVFVPAGCVATPPTRAPSTTS